MKLNLKELWQTVLVLAILAASIANVMLKAYAKSQLPLDSALRTDANANLLQALLLAIVVMLAVTFAVLAQRNERSNKIQNWLVDTVNWNIESLKAVDAQRDSETSVFDKKVLGDARWPWGKHHTETLGHLEAAAKKWWVLYDPSDFTTAPTNEMVSDWLQTERGISKEKARAIASMLRPDRLPTGPRK